MPLRSAATNPPSERSAKQPIASGIAHAVFWPASGSKRLSDGALMSTQYSNCSSTDQTGHSPRLALMSSTHSNGERIVGAGRDRNAHRTRKRGTRREEACARIQLTCRCPVERVGHVRDRLDREIVARSEEHTSELQSHHDLV